MKKMKKGCLFSLVFLLCVCTFLGNASAAHVEETRIDYADGSYAIISIEIASDTRAATEDSKTYTFYNSSRQRCFSYTLFGWFTYSGTTSSADSRDFDIAIYRRGWDVVSHDEYTSGDTAYGEAVFSGPDGEERSVELSLTCDADGNVS